MSAPEPIRMLGRYELLRRIAKGGMGEIYLARTRGMAGFEKNCIIKTMLPHLAEEQEFVTKFLDEGRIVVQLVHGNIVPVFDMGDEDGEVYMAMEYIAGRDLREVTKRLAAHGDTMPVDLALFVASEVCKGLDYAHRKVDEAGESLGIVHRDVSPSNVLISREGEVKLIDFGIARAAGRLGQTVSGRIQGKFCYMSPEQAAGRSLDGRSDTFSAGLVLYELLTGFRPFEGGTDLQSLDLVRECAIDPPGALNLEVPAEIDEIVMIALAKDPADRYPTIDKFQIALMQYLYSSGSSPTSSDLAAFLGDMFPEGLEREELKSARDASPPKKMSLDEALDFELGKLAGTPATVVDPHETTAVSSEELRLGEKLSTRTRAPQAVVADPAAAISEDADRVTATTEVTRRSWIVYAPLAVVVAALAFFAFNAMTQSSRGKRVIDSDPTGAQISVDGALIPGATTPHTLSLDEGRHEVTLELEGYESRTVQVIAEAGTHETVPTTRLRAKVSAQGPRTFTLHAEQPSVEFLRDNVALAQPVVTLLPGELVHIKAQAPGCKSVVKPIDYTQANEGVTFTLDCEEVTPDEVEKPEVVTKTITIKSDPTGASIAVNGKSLGIAPVEWTGPSNGVMRIDARKEDLVAQISTNAAKITGGKVTMKLKAKPGPPGCVIMSVMNPFKGTWYLDGKELGEDRGYTRELAAGPHTIRVVNASEGLDHSQTIEVKPGKNCAKLLLDGAKLK